MQMSNTVIVSVRMEPALADLLRRYSDEFGRSMSNSARLILRDYLRRYEFGNDRNASMRERVTA
jgi:hypothetical protein